jgi:N-acetyl-gamma-glutamyl-phosphate reductase
MQSPNNKQVRAGIIGGAGYTGGEMLRILLQHPNVDIAFIHSRSNGGEPVYKVHGDLLGDTDLRFSSEISDDVEVLFLCVGHGEAKAFLETNTIADKIKIIDLSQDFRLDATAMMNGRKFTYGLPEYNRDAIKLATNIANPGCFATAIQLGLLPLAKAGKLGEVHTTGITGSTGAGQKLQQTSHFSWRMDNIQAYKSLTHQHLNEIMQTIGHLQSNPKSLNFIPWRGDFARGIYVSSYTNCDLSLEEAYQLYKDYYATHAFTHVSDKMIDLKQVTGTNKCLVHLEKVGDKLIIHSAIDNLLKGASGQAVQNMNLLFGLAEDAGLKLKATVF